MAKYDVYLQAETGFSVTVEAKNAEDAARIVQDELTFGDIFKTGSLSLSQLDFRVNEVRKSRQ